jgi:hypothetical protein
LLTERVGWVGQTNAEVMEGVMFHCDGNIIEKLVKDFYKTVERQCTDVSVVNKLQSILEKLYDILIKPLSIHDMFKDLDSKATIIFVPDKICDVIPNLIILNLLGLKLCLVRTYAN